MKKIVLASILLSSLSFAFTIDQIASSAIKNSHNLKAIENSIEVANENIKLANTWKNPSLSFGINDIQFEKPFKRDLEPMQAQYIGYSQVIPLGDKLELKQKVKIKDKRLIELKLEDKKQLLKAKVYELSFDILLLEKELKLLDNYKGNLERLKTLSSSFYALSRNNQNEIINIDISLTKLEIRKRDIRTKIKNLYLKLEELSFLKLITIEDKLKLKDLVLNMDIKNHPKVLFTKEKIKKFTALEKFEDANKYSDIKVNAAYFNRDSKYEDYINLSVNIPLSIYKTEDTKAIRAKYEAKKTKENLEDIKRAFISDLMVLKNSLNNAYSNHGQIIKTLIPLKQKIQKNLENYNTLKNLKPQMAIKNLNELISFEIEALKWQKIYFKNYAKSKYYEVGVNK